jgi:hypothetical protein
MESANYITISGIARRLQLTTLTVQTWYRGSQVRRPLPATVQPHGKSRRLFFEISDITEWLRSYRPDLLPLWEKAGGPTA